MDKLLTLREIGEVAKKAHAAVKAAIRPGVTARELDKIAHDVITGAQMKPAFLGYKGYPAASCISINDEIVHGIPSDQELREGDIVSVDLGVEKDGCIVDTARTHPVGRVSGELSRLLTVTDNALQQAIAVAKPGNRVGDIGAAAEAVVKQGGFHVVRDLTGHGVGKSLQEPPSIPNFGRAGTGTLLEEGMVLAIEPITSLKPTDIAVLSDNWTIVATAHCPCAHFEDTIYLTKSGSVILT
ncbi:MAG: type I methionyl aminopeptidase [Patescibacteria group bacterium]